MTSDELKQQRFKEWCEAKLIIDGSPLLLLGGAGMTLAKTHCLERTSPKGGPFVGYCRLCGQRDLPSSAVNEWCPNPTNKTQNEALLEAINPPEIKEQE